MSTNSPQVVVIAGPNGAGKSSNAQALMPSAMRISRYVNADIIAQGLSGFAPEDAALTASRIMLERLHELADQKLNFAFETTLAGRSYAPWLRSLQSQGYRIRLFFLWLPTSATAIGRVRQRVQTGGHDIDEATIVRRYEAGLKNFFRLYRSIVDDWRMYDNSGEKPQIIASGKRSGSTTVVKIDLWTSIRREFDDA